MKFLYSRYIPGLLLIILAIELVVRMGAYEPFVHPTSHSGTTIRNLRAARDFPNTHVDVVTFGDSRAVQGLDNLLIHESSREYGLNHLRMTMPGSHFLTFKTLSRWSLDELPRLQGVVLAISPAAFGSLGNGAYELAMVLPMRNKTSVQELWHHVPFDSSKIQTFMPLYSLAGYREDFKSLLADPGQRWDKINSRSADADLHFLTYSSKTTTDLCAVATEDPVACLAELQNPHSELPKRAHSGLERLCKAAIRGRESKVPGPSEQILIEEWIDFLDKLSRDVRVLVVIMPDHSLFVDHVYQANAQYVENAVMSELQNRGSIELVDLHQIMLKQSEPECAYFMDAWHLNEKGNDLLSRTLLPELKKFWGALERPDNLEPTVPD